MILRFILTMIIIEEGKMKVRSGFVSNSSSSSFIVKKVDVNEEQKSWIDDPLLAIPRLKEIYEENCSKEYQEYYSFEQWIDSQMGDFKSIRDWNIDSNKHEIKGYTSMDNFSYSEFLEILNIPHTSRD